MSVFKEEKRWLRRSDLLMDGALFKSAPAVQYRPGSFFVFLVHGPGKPALREQAGMGVLVPLHHGVSWKEVTAKKQSNVATSE